MAAGDGLKVFSRQATRVYVDGALGGATTAAGRWWVFGAPPLAPTRPQVVGQAVVRASVW